MQILPKVIRCFPVLLSLSPIPSVEPFIREGDKGDDGNDNHDCKHHPKDRDSPFVNHLVHYGVQAYPLKELRIIELVVVYVRIDRPCVGQAATVIDIPLLGREESP